jgi:hypothetical protein
MAVPVVDDSDWPIVRVTYGEELTLDEVPIGAGIVNRIFETRGPMVAIADISALSLTAITPLIRLAIANEVDKLTDKRAILGEAVIIRTRAARLIFRGYLWLKTTHGYPIQVFEDPAQAEKWARAVLAEVRRRRPMEPGARSA